VGRRAPDGTIAPRTVDSAFAARYHGRVTQPYARRASGLSRSFTVEAGSWSRSVLTAQRAKWLRQRRVLATEPVMAFASATPAVVQAATPTYGELAGGAFAKLAQGGAL
jgi:hypothetical protein